MKLFPRFNSTQLNSAQLKFIASYLHIVIGKYEFPLLIPIIKKFYYFGFFGIQYFLCFSFALVMFFYCVLLFLKWKTTHLSFYLFWQKMLYMPKMVRLQHNYYCDVWVCFNKYTNMNWQILNSMLCILSV